MSARTAALLTSIDPASMRGVELGPLANPVVTADMGQITYVDHTDSARLRAFYADHQDIDVARIVELDHALDGRSLSDALGAEAPFDYVIASHVIEHVPDPIAWLADLRAVLATGGALSLAIPDKRRCFDILRAPSDVPEVIDAHLRRATRPSAAQIFDHYRSAMAWRGQISWVMDPPLDELTPMHSAEHAWTTSQALAATEEYRDVHCWVFTPESLRTLIGALSRLGLVDFALERCTDTVGAEFFVTLRAVDHDDAVRGAPSAAAVASSRLRASDEARTRRADRAAQRADDARAEAEAGAQQLAATLATASWRWTRPLRELSVRLRPHVSRLAAAARRRLR